MRLANAIICVTLFGGLSGCATKNDLDYLRYDVEGLGTRFAKVEKDLGSLRNETREGLEKNLKGIQADIENVRKGAADLQANIEAMKVDMQVVAGKLDDASVAARKPAEELTLLRDDMERRLAAIESRTGKLEKGLEDLRKFSEAQAERATPPEAAYQKGLDSFKSGDIAKARELLTKFIEQNPTHELAANAHYWLGETYYSEKKYDQAVLEFQEVIKNFPGKEKVPAAMLKQAMAFKELGDIKSARYLYKKVMDDFPASDEAKTAQEKLKGLK